jgi:nitrogen fixation protein FixH
VETTGRFKAGHAFVSFLLAFTTIITANVLLATNAVRTFPGLETDSPYVASQTFDKRRAAQEALGWTVDVKTEGGLLILDIRDAAGKPVVARSVEALVGRATHVKDDVTPEFHFDGSGYVARQGFGYGKWEIRMKAVARDGTPFEQTLEFFVPK